jgi:hypothetical protein
MCQLFGGTLISIHSSEENYIAIDLANREKTKDFCVWIGAKRNNSVDYFEWTNGQEFNYSNWASDEPKNSSDPESHVALYNVGTWRTFGKWKNGLWVKCLFICESDSSVE